MLLCNLANETKAMSFQGLRSENEDKYIDGVTHTEMMPKSIGLDQITIQLLKLG